MLFLSIIYLSIYSLGNYIWYFATVHFSNNRDLMKLIVF